MGNSSKIQGKKIHHVGGETPEQVPRAAVVSPSLEINRPSLDIILDTLLLLALIRVGSWNK